MVYSCKVRQQISCVFVPGFGVSRAVTHVEFCQDDFEGMTPNARGAKGS